MNTNTAAEHRNLPLAAFIANDVGAIDPLVQHPPAYIGNGKTTSGVTVPT